jgi:hypothetical protein
MSLQLKSDNKLLRVFFFLLLTFLQSCSVPDRVVLLNLTKSYVVVMFEDNYGEKQSISLDLNEVVEIVPFSDSPFSIQRDKDIFHYDGYIPQEFIGTDGFLWPFLRELPGRSLRVICVYILLKKIGK